MYGAVAIVTLNDEVGIGPTIMRLPLCSCDPHLLAADGTRVGGPEQPHWPKRNPPDSHSCI